MIGYIRRHLNQITITPTKNIDACLIIASPYNLGLPDELLQSTKTVLSIIFNSKDFTAKVITGAAYQPNKKGEFVGEISTFNLVKDISAKNPHDFTAIQTQVSILGKIIERGNEEKLWKICPVAIPIKAAPDKNPLTPETKTHKELATLWKDAASKYIQKNNKTIYETFEDITGFILFSAAASGGLLNTKYLNTLTHQIKDPVIIYKNRIVLPLHLLHKAGHTEQYFRWEPDTLTSLILLNRPTSITISPNNSKQTTFALIKLFLTNAGVTAELLPKNIQHFLDTLASEYHLYLPPFLVSFARRRFISHSVYDQVFHRSSSVITSWNTPNSTPSAIYKNDAITNDRSLLDGADGFKNHFLERINSTLKIIAPKQMTRQLHRLYDDIESPTPPINKYLLKWLITLLTKGSSYGRKIKPSSALSYFKSISQRLVDAFSDYDLKTMSEEDFIDIYTQILETSISLGNRKKLARLLYEFHYFLHKTENIVEINTADVLSIRSQLAPVDANILSEDEYALLLKWVDNNLHTKHPDFINTTKLIITLAYRCGLRRNEALKLRLIDIQGTIDPVLLIRPHMGRTLKTTHSQRQLPLKYFLSTNELTELLAWLKKRKAQQADHNFSNYIFSIPEKNIALMTENIVIPYIHQGMREITGDSSMRFHHFRHSFASWHILRLTLNTLGAKPENLFKNMPLTIMWLNQAKNFRMAVFGSKHPTQKDLYLISSFLGHSSTDITLEHYVHFCDILLACAIKISLPAFHKSFLVHASGLNRQSAYRAINNGASNNLNSHPTLIKATINKLKKNNSAMIVNHDSIVLANSISTPIKKPAHYGCQRIENLWQLLLVSNSTKTHTSKNAERFGYSVKQARTLKIAAAKFTSLQGSTPYEKYRSRRHKTELWEKGNQSINSHPIPLKPRDLSLTNELLEKLWPLLENNDKDLNWFLNYYSNHMWQTNNFLFFNTPGNANRYLQFLKKLNIKNCQRIVKLRYGRNQKPKSLIGFWKKKLTSSRTLQIKRHQCPNDTLGKHGWLLIALEKNNANGVNTKTSSDGLRYAITMLQIYKSIL